MLQFVTWFWITAVIYLAVAALIWWLGAGLAAHLPGLGAPPITPQPAQPLP